MWTVCNHNMAVAEAEHGTRPIGRESSEGVVGEIIDILATGRALHFKS